MNKLFFILLYIFFGSILNAQPYETNPDYKRANIWHFGYGAGIDFNSGSPVTIYGGQTNHTWEGFSSICDTSGSLLLYSDGITVWNNKHKIVENGTGLLGHISSTQGSLLLQHPENDSLIYLFVTRPSGFSNSGLSYNVINIKSNNGEGKVILKNKLLLQTTCEKLTAINHSNGRDIWVIAHGFTTNSYFTYLLTHDCLIECPNESVTGNILEELPALWFLNTQGNLISNYQGNKIAAAILNTGKVEIFDFDNQTGVLNISDTINFNSNVYCVAYNGNGSRLFIQTIDYNRDTSYFYYYENKNLKLITKYLHGQIQYLVNVNEILYIANMDSTFLSTIENINDSIPSFHSKSIDLSPAIGSAGLPNFNQSNFHTPTIDFAYEVNCNENNIQFYGRDTIQASNHDWLITKQGAPSIINHLKTPLIELEDTGTYKVQYIASNGSRSDTVTKEIQILPKIETNFLGNDTGWCENIDTSINIQAPEGMHCYEWNTGETTPEIVVDSSGVYWVKITTPNFCVIYDTINIVLDTIPYKPIIYQVKDTLQTDIVAKSYQWFKNNQPIGTNQPYLKLIDTGIYHLKTTTKGGCISISDTFHVYRVGIENFNFENIKVFPNPFSNHLYINDVNNSVEKLTIQSIEGKILKEASTSNSETIINTSEWSEGIYIVRINLKNQKVLNYKLIKINN